MNKKKTLQPPFKSSRCLNKEKHFLRKVLNLLWIVQHSVATAYCPSNWIQTQKKTKISFTFLIPKFTRRRRVYYPKCKNASHPSSETQFARLKDDYFPVIYRKLLHSLTIHTSTKLHILFTARSLKYWLGSFLQAAASKVLSWPPCIFLMLFLCQHLLNSYFIYWEKVLILIV